MTVAAFANNLLIRMHLKRQRGAWRPLGSLNEAGGGQHSTVSAITPRTSAHATRVADHFLPSPSGRSTRPTAGRHPHPQPVAIDPAELRELIRRQQEHA